MNRSLLMLPVVALLGACSPSVLMWGDFDDVAYEDTRSSNAQGRMVGDSMPEVGSFDAELDRGFVEAGSDWMSFELHTNGDHGWAMMMGWVDVDPQTGTVDAQEGSIIACAGPGNNMADFDQPADEATIETREIEVDGVLMTEIEVQAEYFDGSQVTAVAVVPNEG